MYKHRRIIWICVAIIVLICLGKDSYEEYKSNIKQEEVLVWVDKSFSEDFENITDNEQVLDKYIFSETEDFSKANIILSSDFSKINSEKKYDTLNYSPLIFAMKNSRDLNNFRTANTKQGWLITASKINNDESDIIKCDFKKVFDVVISGGDWSDLGGSDEKIKIYCPPLETTEGQLFKEFLVRVLNVEDGSKQANKEIEAKIEKFFSSSNVIQGDVLSKIKKLENNIPANEIYVSLETDFLTYVYEFEQEHDDLDLSFIYPETCVLREIYLQYNDVDETLQESLENSHFHFSELSGHEGFKEYFYGSLNYNYRDNESNQFFGSSYFEMYNFQQGINAFEMKN